MASDMNAKIVAVALIGLGAIACDRRSAPERPTSAPINPLVTHMLALDSGVITKQDGLPWLLALGVADTTDSAAREAWRVTAPRDTVGKFYRAAESADRLVCCEVPSGDFPAAEHWLLRVAPDGRVLQRQQYFLGKYPCDGKSFLAGLRRRGPWFLLTANDTGAGYCAAFLYVFDRTLPPTSANGILTSLDDDADGYLVRRLTSRLEARADTLLVHYTETRWPPHAHPAAVDKYTIRYVHQDSTWRALDNTHLKPFLRRLE